MRILIQGTPLLVNIGDNSMLKTTVVRLQELCPEASLEVITTQPGPLIDYLPNVKAVVCKKPSHWFGLRDRLRNWMPKKTRQNLIALKNDVGTIIPSTIYIDKTLLATLNQVDSLVLTGSGIMTDIFMGSALRRLELLGKAIYAKKTTVIFGHGFGPVEHPKLIKQMKAVLPKVDLICLRERLNSLPLLLKCGVEPSKIMITGDDAIEMAYLARANVLGDHIGINLRVSIGSELSFDESPFKIDIRTALHEVANRYNISLIPIPIDNSDHLTIKKLLQISNPIKHLTTPQQVIEEIKQCRVVVTGSYHAAVWALSQGIPAIGLVKSSYYDYKFAGLADQFGGGCEVVFLDDPQLREKLELVLENALQNAQKNQSNLLQKAQLQIQASRSAYQKFYELISTNQISHVG